MTKVDPCTGSTAHLSRILEEAQLAVSEAFGGLL
jgi:hypothetical protein